MDIPAALRSSPSFSSAFAEKLELSKSLASRIVKTLELEGFVKLLLIEVLWKDGNLEECLSFVLELLGRI